MPWIRRTLVCFVLAVTILSSSAQNEAVIALKFSSCATYSYSVNEGSSQNLCAVLLYVNGSATLVNDITVQFVPVNGTGSTAARYPADFPYIIYYATFPAGTPPGQQRCVNISTVNDTDVENNEIFTVNLVANSSKVAIGDRAGGTTATITITDNDVSMFTLDGNYSAIEGASTFQVCAVLYSGTPSITGVNLKFTANPMTATATTDYSIPTIPTATVTVNVGVAVGSTVCVTVTIVNDNLVENNETFSITILAGSKSTVISPRIVSYITIIDNDVVVLGLNSATNQLQSPESNASISICVAIMNNIQLAIPVTTQINTLDITATSGLDYLPPTPSTVTFSSGSALNTLGCTGFQVLQDSVVENNEFLLIYLQSTMSQVQILSTAGNATFTIIEDGDTVLIGFSTIAINISEGVNAQICAQIKSGNIGFSVSVYISTTTLGSATANADYVPLTLAPIVFNPGSSASVNSTSCYTLVIMDDDAVENDETISLSMSASTPVNIQQSTSFAVVTIKEGTTDNITVGLSNSVQVTEGLNLTATVCAVILRGSLQVSVSILAFTSNITATPSLDYETKSLTLTFTIGKTVGDSVCFTIGIYNDLIVENPEQFTVNLRSTDSRAVVASGQGQITVTIYDDPTDVVTLGFQNPQYRTTETSSSISLCILMLSGQLGKDVPVLVTTSNQTAVGGVDFVPLNTTIIFRSGMVAGNSLCISIVLIDDIVVEANQESFLVSISDTDPSAIIEAGTSPVYIDEDPDDAVTIGFQYSSYTGNTGTSLTLCTTMYSGTTQRLVSVFATTVSKEAIESVDYVGINARELDFLPGSAQNSTACFNVVILNDTDIELPETFSVILIQTDAAVQLSSQYATAVVTIPLNPADKVVAKMSNSAVSITEMSTTSVCAELESASGNLTYSVTATITFSGTATDVADYTISQRMFVFPAYTAPGVASKMCATLFTLSDFLTEGAEDVIITLTSSTPVLIIDPVFSVTTVTITDP